MIESGWNPGCLGVAGLAIRWVLLRSMGWIGSLVIIILMAAHARIWNTGIIPVVTCIATKAYMGSCKYIIVVMSGKCCRVPSGIRRMAGCTICAEIE